MPGSWNESVAMNNGAEMQLPRYSELQTDDKAMFKQEAWTVLFEGRRHGTDPDNYSF